MTKNNDVPYYFIGCPFSGSPALKQERLLLCKTLSVYFLEKNIYVFAPIVLNESLVEEFSEEQLVKRKSLLMPMNEAILKRSSGLILLTVSGWQESKGIKRYLEMCNENQIPVCHLNPYDKDKKLDFS